MLLTATLILLLSYPVLLALRHVWREWTSPLRLLPGPPSSSLIFGNFKDMLRDSSLPSQWRSQYGRNFLFRSLFARVELHTSDVKAVAHIVTSSAIYQKPPSSLNYARDLLGNGLLAIEGEEHRRQRQIMNTAFSATQIRDLTEVFIERAAQLREVWNSQVAYQPKGVIDMAAQIPTFLLAGQETTSTVLCWALYALSLNPCVQNKLRSDLLGHSTENPTMDDLNALPYLECVVRETLRLYPSVMYNQRMAMQDDVLPLAAPYVDPRGREHQSLLVPKGQIIHVPIYAVNTDPEIWGDNALEFLIKAVLFALIRAFKFTPAIPKERIVPQALMITHRPAVVGVDGSQVSGLPLVVRAYTAEGY
ncbi:cytochrome P450 [Roridomyces roridus]|uniref:Cytochrome P450 n=1 Tax=Roridomyces roridus TaxID=1738132 RepID=A0AAD7B447_9AGAR|nr:cytochrome P450 [Roridomyces roridus]